MEMLTCRFFTFVVILFLFLIDLPQASAQNLAEGFESGLPTTAPGGETTYTLASGAWTSLNSKRTTTKYTGNYALQLSNGSNTPSYIVAPSINNASTLSFWSRGSGASTLSIQKSINGGAFVVVASQSITTTYTQYTFNINENGSVRIKFQNSTSQAIYIDEVVITASTNASPSLSVSPSSLAFGNITTGTTSAEKTYTVTGANLSPATGNITVTAPAGYEISATTGAGFATSINVAYSSSTLASKIIYTRFKPTAAQAYNGNITNGGGGATTQNVAITGTGVELTPSLSVSPSSLSFGNVTSGTISAEKTYIVSGSNLAPAAGNILVTAPAGYEVSATTSVGFGSSINISYSGSALSSTTIYARFKPTAAQAYNGNITNAGGGATTQNVTVTGTGVTLTPSLSVSPSSLSFESVTVGTTSAEKTYTVSGVNLSPAAGNITITAPSGYEVSAATGAGFATSINVAYSSSTLASKTIYTHFKPTAAQAYNGNITNAGGGATTKNVAVTGTGVQATSSTAKYVSTTGSDSNPGTFASPYKTITKAISVVAAGDTIYVRGGTYTYSTTIKASKSGTSSKRYYLLGYPGERPVLNFSSMSVSGSNRGMNVTGSYWYIKGFDFYKAGDNGMNITGANNIIEFCSFYENSDTGLQMDGGAANNQVINCDSYYNADPSNGNADGFAIKLDVGSGNYCYGCRAWQNSDDGWDGYLRPSNDVTTTLENCWCFKNGYLKSGSASAGNGNGYKMGGSDNKDLKHNFILKNCLSFQNRVKGYDQNNNKGSMTLYNCTAFSNGTNYSITSSLASGKTLTLKNCVSAGSGSVSLLSSAVQQTNSWQSGFSVSNADFTSIDPASAYGARNADGSLPDISFMHLAAGSDLIDRGTNIGLPFNGSAPDLGCFETQVASLTARVAQQASFIKKTSLQVTTYPNPANDKTTIRFSVKQDGPATVKLFTVYGQQAVTLFYGSARAGATYSIPFNATGLKDGAYFISIENGGSKQTTKMILQK